MYKLVCKIDNCEYYNNGECTSQSAHMEAVDVFNHHPCMFFKQKTLKRKFPATRRPGVINFYRR